MNIFQKTFLAFLVSFASIISANAHDSYSYYDDVYDYYSDNLGVECPFSSVSVGVGNVLDGVVVTIDSFDEEVTRCIKKTSWISYFSDFGNSVKVDISNTTLWVQIVATSKNSEVSINLKNVQWSRVITSRPSTYISSRYSKRLTRTLPRYTPRRRNVDIYDNNNYYNNNYYNNTYSPYNYWYNLPTRSYTAWSSIFNTSQMYRSMTYLSNGVKMSLSSPDYRTMSMLQSYYFTGLFSDFSGISVSISNIAWGVEVTVTSGNTSTVEQIQKIGYAIIYN